MKYKDIELSVEQFKAVLKETKMTHEELAYETGYEKPSIAAMACGARKISKRVTRYLEKNKKRHLERVLGADEEIV